MNELLVKNESAMDVFFDYYEEALFLSDAPHSTDVQFMYESDVEHIAYCMEEDYRIDEKEGEGYFGDAYKVCTTEYMTLEKIETALMYLGLFYVNQYGMYINQPFENVW